jgi:hypothetical protein
MRSRVKLGWSVLGALLGIAVLLVLGAALPGPLPAWVGYAIAVPCFAFVWVQAIRARRAERVARRSSAH